MNSQTPRRSAGKAQAAVVEAALGVLVVEAEKRAADLAQAQAALADERGRLLELVSLLRSRGVAIPSALQAFFSPPADLRTIGSVVVSAGPWADRANRGARG